MNPDTRIKKGQLLNITNGCYSDYTILGTFKALKDFAPYDIGVKWIAETPENVVPGDPNSQYSWNRYERRWKETGPDKFVAHLVSLGLIEEVEHTELYLGEYGDILRE